jgi:hypothetical protein
MTNEATSPNYCPIASDEIALPFPLSHLKA